MYGVIYIHWNFCICIYRISFIITNQTNCRGILIRFQDVIYNFVWRPVLHSVTNKVVVVNSFQTKNVVGVVLVLIRLYALLVVA